MSRKPVRFIEPPSLLSNSLNYPPFEVRFGIVPNEGHILVAVWRRAGTSLPYEPVSAAFISDYVEEVMGEEAYVLPSCDEDIDEALRALQFELALAAEQARTHGTRDPAEART